MTRDKAAIGWIFRAESGRAVAALISMFGDIDLAEDAVQEAFTIALQKWPLTGVPPNPGAWVTATARNRAIDRLRRDARGANLLRDVAAHTRTSRSSDEPSKEEVVPDDRLRLIFTCCHPALAPQAQVELTLRLLCGLSTADVARAFLTSEPTMAKRLVRAKHKIKAAKIPYRVPEQFELPDRLQRVLAAIYLTYTTGQAKSAAEPDLCTEAVRLGGILRLLMPDESEVAGLLALMLLTESRRATRTDPQGELVLLRDQDRTRWDRSLIEEGQALVRWCLRRNQPGAYQLQAAIAAVHADAITFQDTPTGTRSSLCTTNSSSWRRPRWSPSIARWHLAKCTVLTPRCARSTISRSSTTTRSTPRGQSSCDARAGSRRRRAPIWPRHHSPRADPTSTISGSEPKTERLTVRQSGARTPTDGQARADGDRYARKEAAWRGETTEELVEFGVALTVAVTRWGDCGDGTKIEADLARTPREPRWTCRSRNRAP